MPSVYEGNILTVNQASESSTVHSLLLQPAKKKKIEDVSKKLYK